MKTNHASLICVAVLVLPACCGKHEPPIDLCPSHNSTTTLPPATQCGANTFGCMVNGQVWVPVNDFIHGAKKLHADWYNGAFVVYGQRILQDTYESIVYMRVDSIWSTGTFSLNNRRPGKGEYHNYLDSCDVQTDSTWGGWVAITRFDRTNYIISGTFEFTVVSTGCDTIRITEGRFDVTE